MADGRPRLVLWDIDGTLVRAGDVGAHVFDQAIEQVVGIRPPSRPRMSGKTDPQIVREYLAMLELAQSEAEAHLPAVLAALAEALASAAHRIAAEGSTPPGIPEVLVALGRRGVHQSVLTGNIAPNAVVKLAAFGLERHLDLEIGAYGSDHADRRRLVPVALGRCAARGLVVDRADVWVVGDAANDLACARAGGVRCLLVATGRSSYDELAALGPDALFGDLGDVAAVSDLLSS